MEKELSQKISMSQVREAVTHHFKSVFGFDLVRIDAKKMNHLVNCGIAEDGFVKQ
jgi:lipoate-protein ligase B